jgi:hypothetical protein
MNDWLRQVDLDDCEVLGSATNKVLKAILEDDDSHWE